MKDQLKTHYTLCVLAIGAGLIVLILLGFYVVVSANLLRCNNTPLECNYADNYNEVTR